MSNLIISLLEKAIEARQSIFDEGHQSAFRLFNGFYEGYPDLAVDVYGHTVLVHNHADDPTQNTNIIQAAIEVLHTNLNWLRAGVVKFRNGKTPAERRGQLLFGKEPNRKIKEHEVWYAIDLMMNRDASFYLDTRDLRKWIAGHVRGRTVLNTFAYTGSLGVAAMAGGASRVVQTDRNRQFLDLAKDSYSLNSFSIHKADFIAQDFFPVVARFKSTKQFFDCVIVDPPFFSTTSKGKVDLVNESARLINKVRPLINDGGHLIAINNALYVNGAEYMQTLEGLCKDGYLAIEELVPVPEDFIGYNRVGKPITDPGSFNHSTKITILKVKRK